MPLVVWDEKYSVNIRQCDEQHKKLIALINELHAYFTEGQHVLSAEVMQFLKNWLMGHIQGTDKQYSEHMNARGVS